MPLRLPIATTTASSTATSTIGSTTTTVVLPAATSTPFNIYTRPTVPPTSEAIMLGIVALLLLIGGTYLLATRPRTPDA